MTVRAMPQRQRSMDSAIMARYLADPRRAFAQQVMQQGASTAPAQSWLEAAARALQGGVGGYFAGQVRNEYQAQDDEYRQAMSNALAKLGQGEPVAGAQGSLAQHAPQAMGRPKLTPDQIELARALSPGTQEQLIAQYAFPTQKEAEPFTLGEGQNRYDAAGRIIASGPAKKEEPQKPITETFYEGNQRVVKQYDQATGQWVELSRGDAFAPPSSTNVRVESGPQFGTIPPGWEIRKTPDGSFQMAPIKGGPAEREIQAGEAKAEQAKAQTVRTGGVVVEDIERIQDIVRTSDWPTTGFFGARSKNIEGTPAYDIAVLLDGIKSNIGFDRLQQMRAASPTGGALGPVSDTENRLLQSAYGRLEQSASGPEFMRNLDRVKQIYTDIIHGPNKASAQPASPDTGSATDEEVLRNLGITQ